MNLKHLILGRLDNNCYILKRNNKCLIIDPADNAKKIIDACQGYLVEEILVTHHHWDHILALDELENYYHIKHNTFLRKTFSYEIIKTPGHASDSLTFYFKDEKIMFTGDFLFYHTIGRCDLESSNPKDMIESLKKIQTYPDDTLIYPGHGKSSILKEEKKYFNEYIFLLEKNTL